MLPNPNLQNTAANLPTIIVSLILCALVVLVIIRLVKNRKKGKMSCGGQCEGCAYRSKCKKS